VIIVRIGRIDLSVVGSVGSTNADAAGMDLWSALLAREQMEGRGRLDHSLSEFGIDVSVRWPNDILVEDRKIAGILSEHKGDKVIVGIGINVNNTVEDRPFPATSVLEQTGKVSDVEGIARRILELIQDVPSAAEVMNMWRDGSITEGKHVSVTTLSGIISGTAVGIRDDGALLVDTGSGTESITEGECRFA